MLRVWETAGVTTFQHFTVSLSLKKKEIKKIATFFNKKRKKRRKKLAAAVTLKVL